MVACGGNNLLHVPLTLTDTSTGRVLADDVRRARTFKERTKGLIGRAPLQRGQALLLEKAPQIHTFGVAYPLDVVFCDKALRVKHVTREIRPRRLGRWVFGAYYAIEFPAGSVDESVRPGAQLSLSER